MISSCASLLWVHICLNWALAPLLPEFNVATATVSVSQEERDGLEDSSFQTFRLVGASDWPEPNERQGVSSQGSVRLPDTEERPMYFCNCTLQLRSRYVSIMAMENAQQSNAAGLTKDQKVWNVMPSEFSYRCSNPIRKIVDNIKKPESLDKPLIPLSLGAFLEN